MKHVVEHKNRGRERKGKRATHYNIYCGRPAQVSESSDEKGLHIIIYIAREKGKMKEKRGR